MKKIMFNDRFGLTMAVINGTKTQTRRIIPEKQLCDAMVYGDGDIELRNLAFLLNAPYKVGEVIAVAQSYEDLGLFDCRDLAGYRNKMFVKAELMPHRIKITRVRLQLLQDISENDCLREGVEKWLDSYIVTGIMERNGKNNVCFNNPRDAFSVLIDRISGKGTWERNPYVLAYDFELVTNCHRLI